MRWSGLSSQKISPRNSSRLTFVSTMTMPPLCRRRPSFSSLSPPMLSSLRENSRALKLMISFPFLNLSISSSTVIGITTLCSSKELMQSWS